jgi:hypothetical protein
MRAVHRQMRSALRVSLIRPPERLRLRVQRDCTPPVPRFSPFAFGVALTGAGALGALLALTFRSPSPPADGAELATPEPVRPPGGRATVGPAPPTPNSDDHVVFTGRIENLGEPAPAAAATEPTSPGMPSGPAEPAPAGARPAAAAPGCAPLPAPVLVQLEGPPPPAAPTPASVHARLAACSLQPAVVTALTGQAIQVQNTGAAPRDVQIDREPGAGAAYSEGVAERLPVGGSVTRTFNRPGLYPVWCDGGAQPCGYLAVAAHPQFAVVDQPAAAGTVPVQFRNAPAAAGNLAVAVYQLRRRAQAAGITLDASGAGQLRLDPLAEPQPVAALALNGCRQVRDRASPVAHACARGGIQEAKKAMKNLVKRAKNRGLKFECDSCHRNETDWQLTDDARANFTSMLAATGT